MSEGSPKITIGAVMMYIMGDSLMNMRIPYDEKIFARIVAPAIPSFGLTSVKEFFSVCENDGRDNA